MEEKKKILIIEDEKYLLDMYKEILKNGGFEVFTALDGKEGLDIARREKINIILLDLMMSGIDGMQVLTEIKNNESKYGKPVILVLTNLSSEIAIKSAFAEKADGYLMKAELTPKQILSEVKRFIDK